MKKKIVKSDYGDFRELNRHVGTRWLSLLHCIGTALLNWKPSKSYFLSLGDSAIILKKLHLLKNSDVNFDLICLRTLLNT